jgi:hypothetical protein
MLQQKSLSILSKRHQAWHAKSKPQFKQAPFCTTFLYKAFSLFQHHSNLFYNNSFDENQYGPEEKIHLDAKIK